MAKSLEDLARERIRKLGGKTTISRKGEDGKTIKQTLDGIPVDGTDEALVAMVKKSLSSLSISGGAGGLKRNESGKDDTGDGAALMAYQIITGDVDATEIPADFKAKMDGKK